MLRQFGPSTLVALLSGGLLSVMLFLPVAAIRYRRAGRLRLSDLVLLVAVATYFMALWSYTLVPFPAAGAVHCTSAQLRPFQFVADIANDPHLLLHNRALLQAVFNVVLFLPLGFFLRMLARRGVLASTVIGFGVSAAIEFTQLTGVWGIYRCAYRVFDVDDLLLNTTGAALGSLLALPIVLLLRRRLPAPKVTRITVGRRLVGVAIDIIAMLLLGAMVGIGWRAVELYGLGWRLGDDATWSETALALGVPGLAELAWILRRGSTFGEAAVGLEPVARPGRELFSRLVKFITGVGGYLILSAGLVPVPALSGLFVVASLIAVIATRNHRGLSHAAADMELRVRGTAAGDPPGQPPAESATSPTLSES